MFLWHHRHPRDIDIRIDIKVEAHMLSVWFETLTGYPNAQSPSTGILIGLDDANLTCTVTIANAYDLATTSTPAPRAIETRITQHKVYEWCVVVATAIFGQRRSRRRFAEPLRNSRNQLHHTSSQPACTLVYFRVLTICHKGDTLCSFGQGTTPGLPYTRKGCVGEAPRCCLG